MTERGTRSESDRSRRRRRRPRLRTLLFAAAALVTPGQLLKLPLVADVATSIGVVTPLSPDQAYDHLIAEAAELYDLNPALIKAVIRIESSFDPLTVSPVGAQGLMQLMPALAEDLGVTNAFDPRENIMAGSKYLRQLLDATRGSLPLALASYNAGPATVARYKGIPPFKETRNYVRKVTALLALEDASD